MSAVNQFNGLGGTPGFNNWPNLTQPYAATPTKPLCDPSKATVQAFSFAPYKPAEQEQPKYVTMEEFNKFKEEIQNGKQFIRKGNSRNGKPGGKQSADDAE